MAEISLFKEDEKKEAKLREALPIAFSEKINSIAARLKFIEERYSNLIRRLELLEKNILDFERDLRDDFNILNAKVLDFKKKIKEMSEKVEEMGSELEKTATSYELKVLEKYLTLWQPLHFITKEEAELIISKLKQEKEG